MKTKRMINGLGYYYEIKIGFINQIYPEYLFNYFKFFANKVKNDYSDFIGIDCKYNENNLILIVQNRNDDLFFFSKFELAIRKITRKINSYFSGLEHDIDIIKNTFDKTLSGKQ